MGGQTYRDLEVWQKSMDLVVQVYELSKLFPKEEQFGLTETETQLLLSLRLAYLSKEQLRETWTLAQQVGRLLNGLIRSLESKKTISTPNGRISETGAPFDVNYNSPEDNEFASDIEL